MVQIVPRENACGPRAEPNRPASCNSNPLRFILTLVFPDRSLILKRHRQTVGKAERMTMGLDQLPWHDFCFTESGRNPSRKSMFWEWKPAAVPKGVIRERKSGLVRLQW